MSKPTLVRADTLDLQDPSSPSAQDHQRQPAHPAPLGQGPPAPHQSASLRHAQEERAAEQAYLTDQWDSSRDSHEGSELLEEDPDIFSDNSAAHSDEQGMHQVGRTSEDSDMTDADENDVDDDMVDKISSSPSIDDEDIDFEFVYALHTFVATVEGQANASKGDAMQLLDDSNSYWWLVRVVKDSSIGYLPAEHIETPTERLARLNKHRNADLSREHLGDNEAKQPKNMLKQALKRRNAKMVQFTTPIYYEPSEVDWSEDDERDPDELDINMHDNRSSQEHEPTTEHERAALAEQSAEQAANLAVQNAAPGSTAAVADMSTQADAERPSDDSLERSDSGSKRSRNGTLRNTDSFFKDETAEPKKLSLTPSLLRDADQGVVASPRSSESKDKITSPVSDIFENLDKGSPTLEKFKDDRKKKKDKPGMLSGLFKRKEKKIKVDEAAGGTVRTSQSDLEGMIASAATSSPTESSFGSPKEISPQASRRPSATGGKLTKSPPTAVQSTLPSTSIPSTAGSSARISPSNSLRTTSIPSTVASNTAASGLAQRAVTEDAIDRQNRQPLRIQPPGNSTALASSSPSRDDSIKKDGGILSPLSGLVRDPNEPKKEKLKQAKQRMELDVDSSPEREITPLGNYRNATHTPPLRTAPSAPQQEPFSPEAVSPVDASFSDRFPPGLDISKSVRSDSPVSPSTPTESTQSLHTPDTISEEPKNSTAPTSTASDSKARTGSASESEWNDAALHHYLENDSANDVRDLLLLVHDKNDVKPVTKDHPIMKELNFEQHQKRLDAMSTQLDGLLNDFLARKAAKRKTPVSPVASSNAV